MALIKDMVDPYDEGTLLAYYRLSGLVVDPATRTIHATFLIYRSQRARDIGKDSFGQLTLYADAATTPSYDDLAGDQTAQAASIGGLVYGFAKGQPALTGATDA